MTDDEITLIRDTWNKVLPHAEEAGDLFYARLFVLNPKLKSLFQDDIRDQGRKLMVMIDVAVAHLERLDTIRPAIEDLGQRHVHYGVRSEDYDTVGQALLWTLTQALGPRFTPGARAAWSKIYTTLASIMDESHATRAGTGSRPVTITSSQDPRHR
ncbi:MAG: globin family protein [Acidiferrobacteraceae bacterium]